MLHCYTDTWCYAALPFTRSPEQHPTFKVYFSKDWADTFVLTLHNFFSTLFSCLHILKFQLSFSRVMITSASRTAVNPPLTLENTLLYSTFQSLTHSLTHSHMPCLLLLLLHSMLRCFSLTVPYLSQLCSTLKQNTRRCRLWPQKTIISTSSWPVPSRLWLRQSQLFRRWKPG